MFFLRVSLAEGILVLMLGITVAGCSSPRTAQELDERMQALGTWEYHTSGLRALNRGTLQIGTRDGELVGRLQDRWRGQIEAEVRLQGSHMELTVDRLRITGRITGNRFAARVRRPRWDVTRDQNRRNRAGSFTARRVESGTVVDNEQFGCPSLLREDSYACTPFQSR